MLEILTHLNKSERVSRKIDSSNFVATPGIWGAVQADGSLANIADDAATVINKLVITSSSSSVYESHDVEVGRITTLESVGVRIKMDSAGYALTPAFGDYLMVSSTAAYAGKLVSVGDEVEAAGNREVVARCEQVNADGTIIIRTITPYIHVAS